MKDLLKNNWVILLLVIFTIPFAINTKKNSNKVVSAPILVQQESVQEVSKPINNIDTEPADKNVAPKIKKQAKKSGHVQRVGQPILVRSEFARTSEITAVEGALKQLVIQNKCTKKNFGYKHWTGTYYPSKFVLKFDNKVVLTFNGKEFQYPIAKIAVNKGQILKARFDWEFLGGRRSGWKEIEFKIHENADRLDLHFDWKSEQKDGKNDPWQLTIMQATPMKQNAAENK